LAVPLKEWDRGLYTKEEKRNMTTRILGPTGGKRRRRLLLLVPFTLLAALVLTIGASGVVGESGFEDDDGNLVLNTAGLTDWNSFAPVTWTGTAPNRISEDLVNGWAFDGIEDAQATTSDNAFAGGTKQDDECGSVISAKAPNKDDLKRVYFASKTVNNHVYLNLAWVRIPQNTTSPSAHVAFEFNQSETACPPGSDGLVERSSDNGGDVLIVYDFEGGATDTPTIRLSRWITEAGPGPSGTCEVGSHDPSDGCWNTAQTLGPGVAEARVNTSLVGPVQDTIQPPPAENPLGLNEFGEAGIDLTDAGVFPAGQCVSFGNAFAVSRTSGSSSTAQMKDLVGPGNVNLQNCGDITIIKRTNPRGVDQDFSFTSNIAGNELACTPDTTPASFTLNDDAGVDTDPPADGGNTEFCDRVPAGNYTVTEGADPTGFVFESLNCTATGTGTSATTSGKVASITIAGGGSVTCIYVNQQQLGAIKVTKTRKHAAAGSGDHPHAGVTFTVDGRTGVTDANGVVCFDGLPFGTYTVTETVPAGYSVDANPKSATVNTIADCDDDPYGGASVSFHNTPLTDITVSINSQVDGGTASTVSCTNGGPSGSTGAGGDGTFTTTNLPPNTYVCTVVVDP
jgi:hypothetical protein